MRPADPRKPRNSRKAHKSRTTARLRTSGAAVRLYFKVRRRATSKVAFPRAERHDQSLSQPPTSIGLKCFLRKHFGAVALGFLPLLTKRLTEQGTQGGQTWPGVAGLSSASLILAPRAAERSNRRAPPARCKNSRLAAGRGVNCSDVAELVRSRYVR
jgi:hypothetical protein